MSKLSGNTNNKSGSLTRKKREYKVEQKSKYKLEEKMFGYISYALSIERKIYANGGWKLVSLSDIAKECKVSGRTNNFKFFLFESGFFRDTFGWEIYYSVPGLRQLLKNKYVAIIFLRVIVDYYNLSYFKYEKERELLSTIVNHIDACWEKEEMQIELSEDEYIVFADMLLHGNFYKNSAGNLVHSNDETSYEKIENESWNYIETVIAEKYEEIEKVFFRKVIDNNRQSAWICSQANNLGIVKIKVPKYMRYLFAGLMNSVKELPITVDTNLWGGNPAGQSKRDYDINVKWNPLLKLPNESLCLSEEEVRTLARVVRYIMYNSNMDEREYSETFLDDYFYSLCKIMYQITKEINFRDGAISALENMFGLFLNKIEIEKICKAFATKQDYIIDDYGMDSLGRILRGIFILNRPFFKIFIVDAFMDEILDDFMRIVLVKEDDTEKKYDDETEQRIYQFLDMYKEQLGQTDEIVEVKSMEVRGMSDTNSQVYQYSVDRQIKYSQFAELWIQKIRELEKDWSISEAILDKEENVNNEGNNRKVNALLREYTSLYEDIIKNAREWEVFDNRPTAGTVMRYSNKKCKGFAKKLSEEIVSNREDIALWVIKSNLGIYENRKITVIDY